MKIYVLSIFVLLLTISSRVYSQTAKRFSYLIVNITSIDFDEEKIHYVIQPEQGNPNAASVNALIKYSPKVRAKGTATLYGYNSDTTKPVFNYFQSISEALQFLDMHGWQLFSIVSQTTGFGNTINSTPVYYLRKEENRN